jgi:hypothetical protein
MVHRQMLHQDYICFRNRHFFITWKDRNISGRSIFQWLRKLIKSIRLNYLFPAEILPEDFLNMFLVDYH